MFSILNLTKLRRIFFIADKVFPVSSIDRSCVVILRSKALCQQSSEFDEDADLVVSIILSISLPGLLPGYTIYRILWEGGREGRNAPNKAKKTYMNKLWRWKNHLLFYLILFNKLTYFSRIIPFIKKILLLTFRRKENILKTT